MGVILRRLNHEEDITKSPKVPHQILEESSEADEKEEYLDNNIVQRLSPMFGLIKPLLWPKKSLKLRVLLILSSLSVIFGCFVNLWVPIYAQRIVDSLSFPIIQKGDENQRTLDFRYDLIFIFVALKLCQGIGALSLITCLQQIMWIPIEHHARHQIQVKFFEHLHKMSFTWHSHSKTGDIISALEKGTEGVTSTLEHLVYSLFPTIADILIAMSYLTWKFGWAYGIIVGSQITLYFTLTAYLIEKRSVYQTSIHKAEGKLLQNVMESLSNCEIVKCFGNEDFEKEKYSKSLKELQSRQYLIKLVTNGLQSIQLLVIYSGLLACSLLVVSAVSSKVGDLTAGDYVLCTSYLAQLYGPLNYLGRYYKELRVNLMDTECMLEYLDEPEQIKNAPWAYDIDVKDGSIEFRDVSYSTGSGEAILKNVTFSIAPNSTVALVGESGGGKTSIVRLLMRVIEATSGEVVVDGINIEDVTMESVRSAISIVPQDTVLFNDSIRNNIKYGKLSATDQEVTFAATAAEIHEKITTFPDGYDTMVGERGTRLSGGERQRIAISRAILKDPKILILDEATSALDTNTEKEIQQNLKELCKNRTCLIITHRLNPVVDADCIFVLKNGQIVESGKHSALLEWNGIYAEMWKQQNKSPEDEFCTSLSPNQNRRL